MWNFTNIIKWATDRFNERSTWDGTVILGLSVLFLVAAPIIKYVAWAGIIYGVVRIFNKDSMKQ